MKLFAVSTALVSMASALPSSTISENSLFSLYQIARFDNAKGLPVVAAGPINIYQNIKWNGMTLVQTGGIQKAAILEPNSPPNLAGFSSTNLVTIQQGTPAMTVNYADSTIDSFDLYSFYYGCTLNTQASLLGVPTSCNITVTGYADDQATNQLAKKTFNFDVGTAQTNAQMQKAVLGDSFRKLKRVEFTVTNTMTIKTLFTSGFIDTAKYMVYSTSMFQ
ncbi:hypothetical protein EJ02DRAFT_370332 [Clathrospora elynae]|uniref:DUF7371 domain-containing protein n=1 Tax=Clathrospora elynae TaxID=706981 RepID=A0A6A5SYN2_9PLEO|nr:hypothetical protein EJ02DRAFT_370332 [Clathrospora elynae]